MLTEPTDFLKACKSAGDYSYIDGAYTFRAPNKRDYLMAVASVGGGWDHVSVSLVNRSPTWVELEYIRSLFFLPSETVMQLHVPQTEHINCHEYCLHLWRPQEQEIPRPPAWMVGPQHIGG